MKFGYMRVSTIDQNLDRQKSNLKNLGVNVSFLKKSQERNGIRQS